MSPNAFGSMTKSILIALGLAMALSACTTVLARKALPEDLVGDLQSAAPYGIDGGPVRFWGDNLTAADASALMQDLLDRARKLKGDKLPTKVDWLILSGGGPDGAFGAGVLAGWQARGDRPDFRLVTGVSTGAILAVFAFLGPEHDETIKELYTTHTTRDIATRSFFSALTGGTALLDTRRYRAIIDSYVTDEMVMKLADKYRRGYTLLIGTTNLDASRPVIWNIGEIAASGHPMARQLIQDVLQASSAIPAVFPPVLIPVTAGGQQFDEMHVDGGATQQLMLFSPSISMKTFDEALGTDIQRSVYIIINNKLTKPYEPVRPRVLSIAGTAISSLIGGSGTGDIYKIFAIARRDGENIHVTSIPEDFDYKSDGMFDPKYMTALYDLGYKAGVAGVDWLSYPPDFVPGN